MKTKLIVAASVLFLTVSALAGYRYYRQSRQPLIAGRCCGAEATCTGDKYCHACKNCKYCKHCSKDGGSCGVCK